MDAQTDIKSEVLDFTHLDNEFISLRVGENIPRLEIARVRRVINGKREDNLAGVDYRYFIDTLDHKVLIVNSWVLWRKIAIALKQAGKMQATLSIDHIARKEYIVKLLGAEQEPTANEVDTSGNGK